MLFAGYPVLTLGACRLLAQSSGGSGVMDLALLGALPRFFGVMTNEVLIAIRFHLHGRDAGTLADRGGAAESMGRLFACSRAGASRSSSSACFSLRKGVVGATTVTIGLIMLPTMLRHG